MSATRFQPDQIVILKGSAYNKILDVVEGHQSLEERVDRIETRGRRKDQPPWFYARIDSSAAMSDETQRFRYAWTRMQLSGAVTDLKLDTYEEQTFVDEMEITTPVRQTTTSLDYAINLAEDGDVANRPAQAVPDNTIVRIWMLNDTGGEVRYVFSRGSSTGGFWVLLTGRQLIGGATNRWEHSWKEAIWDNSATKFIAKPGGQTSTVSADDFGDPAYNSIETANQGTGIESGGVDVGGAAYPGGFALKPIQGSSSATWTDALSPAVFLRSHTGDDDANVWIFEHANAHDGTCS